MCGRYVAPEEATLARFWPLNKDGELEPFGPRYNVAPTTPVPIVFIENGAPVVARARWGLVPIWWKQPKLPPFTFNARIEEAAAKPMWRTPLKHSRCLVPALGWYEWRAVQAVDPITGEIKAAKQPHFLHLPDRGLVHFAGLMSRREAREGEPLAYSCTIMTRAAVGAATEVHERMPVILQKEALREWMDPTQKDSDVALAVAEGSVVTDVMHYPVSTRVNQAKNEGIELIEPLEQRPET
jgi:putative SOS response-associated peptidase YedK